MALERIEDRHGERPAPSVGQRINDQLVGLAVERSRRPVLPYFPERPLSDRAQFLVGCACIAGGLLMAAGFIMWGR